MLQDSSRSISTLYLGGRLMVKILPLAIAYENMSRKEALNLSKLLGNRNVNQAGCNRFPFSFLSWVSVYNHHWEASIYEHPII